jgi:hypothetical protein
MNTHHVISAFLDDEPFEAKELVEALSEAEGRALLIDLIALRHLTLNGSPQAAKVTPRRFEIRPLLAAAAVLIALVGGYVVGERRQDPDTSTPPAATRVVEAPGTWQLTQEGSKQ